MAALLRRATRQLSSLPIRGGGKEVAPAGLVKPINDNFPLTSPKVMGRHGWMKGSYTILSINNPIKGPLYSPSWLCGGIHNPTIDPLVHFHTKDRFQTVSFWEFVKCFLYCLLPARPMFGMVAIPITCVFLITCLERRREPMEIYMDREKYWENYDDYYYGVYFDHHHFSHQLCQRRAHKWGYAGQDITLEGHGHDDHHH